MPRPAKPLFLALCSAAAAGASGAVAPSIALCAAVALPDPAGTVPEWIHLLPAGAISTVDGRGPYRVADAAALIAASLQDGARLPVCENHAMDRAAPQGGSSPARGWIVALQSRDDGIWGRIEWTAAGAKLVADKEYRHVSPVILHRPDGAVINLLRASLVNNPNLRGLVALNDQGPPMNFIAQLRAALGLGADADEAAVLAAVTASAGQVSAQAAQLAPIARAAGLPETADATAVLGAVQALNDPAKTVPATTVVALQSEIRALKDDRAREKATAFVDAAIKAGKIAQPQAMRDHYVARHVADPAAVEKELGAMISLHARSGATAAAPPVGADGKPELDGDEAAVVALMGLDPAAFKKTKEAQASRQESL